MSILSKSQSSSKDGFKGNDGSGAIKQSLMADVICKKVGISRVSSAVSEVGEFTGALSVSIHPSLEPKRNNPDFSCTLYGSIMSR